MPPNPSRAESAPPSPARLAAASVLLALDKGRTADAADALDREITERGMGGRDARLATALLYGVLRHRSFLDLQWLHFSSRKSGATDFRVATVLRLAAAQQFVLERIPPHAIANESVGLARALGLAGPRAGFVNAVVRKLVALEKPVRVPASTDPAATLALQYSHPAWLIALMAERFRDAGPGSHPSVLEEILKANNREAPLCIRANRLRTTPAELAEAIGRLGLLAAESAFSPEALRVTGPDAVQTLVGSPLGREGLFYIQDEASQLVAHAAAPVPGMRILDLCAAPGGKSTHLAELSGGEALIVATDVSPGRLEVLRQNVERLGTPGITVLAREEAAAPGRANPYDLVLVDAPCSGLGTLRRHPEIRWNLKPERIRELAGRQLALLREAAALVRPGGRVVYSTCTFTSEENGQVVAEFLRTAADFIIDRRPSPLETLRRLQSEDGHYRTWPQLLEMDGFEMAVLVRQPRE